MGWGGEHERIQAWMERDGERETKASSQGVAAKSWRGAVRIVRKLGACEGGGGGMNG